MQKFNQNAAHFAIHLERLKTAVCKANEIPPEVKIAPV